jgi:hypothetical protein
MAVVTDARTTGNVLAAQRVVDMADEILDLEPNAAPLTVITKRLDSRPAMDPLFSWLNDELESRFAVINGAQTSTELTLVVDDSTHVPAESLVKVPRTGEIMFVASKASATDLTVVRGFSGTTAAALNDDDPLYLIGVAEDENSTSQTTISHNPTKVDNYTQIFKKSVEASGSWLSSSNITNTHDWNHQRKVQAIEHLVDVELAFLFGGAATVAGTDGARRTTGGVLSFATQNNQDAAGALTEAEWETFLRTLFRYGSQKKTVFASPLVISVLNAYSSGKLVTAVGDETYGVKVMNMVSAHGEVTLVKHNLLQGAIYGGYAIALDFAKGKLAYRFLNGSGPGGSRDTKLYTNRQTPDKDGRKDEWITEAGLQFGLPKVHGVLTGVTS